MKKILFFLIFASASTAVSQKKKEEQQFNIVSHTLALGETVKMVSKKYLVAPSEIYKLNKSAVNGVSGGMVLYIPVPIKEAPIQTNDNEVATKVNNDVAKNSNVEEVAQPSASMSSVKTKGNQVDANPLKNNVDLYFVTHIVKPKETLYSLSREYNVSVATISTVNSKDLKNGLKIGIAIKIPTTEQANIELESKREEIILENTYTNVSDNATDIETKAEYVDHKVLPGETLFGLAKKYCSSVEEIDSLNQDISRKGLQVGQTIKIKTASVY